MALVSLDRESPKTWTGARLVYRNFRTKSRALPLLACLWIALHGELVPARQDGQQGEFARQGYQLGAKGRVMQPRLGAAVVAAAGRIGRARGSDMCCRPLGGSALAFFPRTSAVGAARLIASSLVFLRGLLAWYAKHGGGEHRRSANRGIPRIFLDFLRIFLYLYGRRRVFWAWAS